MNALLVTAALLAATPSPEAVERASTMRVLVWAPELAPRQQQALAGAAQKVLAELTAFDVSAPQLLKAPCEGAACLGRQTSAEAPFVIALSAAVPSLVLELRGELYDAGTGARVRKTVRGGNPDAPQEAVRTLLDALLPKWARKGQASIAVRAPNEAVVKVDGRRVALTPLGDAVGVPAGVHDIDVVFPNGDAVLFRRKLEEGARFTAQVDPSGALAELQLADTVRRPPALRYVSYGLFGAGAVAIAGSLIAGGLARGTAHQLRGCDPADRSCLRIDEANALHARAERYAQTGNVLLVGGAVLGAAGIGVFAFDVAGGR
ncbi:MAG: hypothetical protein IRZ16_01980 [Myxococcaceae bacterium]|nr:hypothetical protein [Myxococcaceae bacterium]